MVKSITEEKIQTVCILILTSIAVAAALKLFSSVLIPFVLAIFLTFCLSTLIDVQIKWMRAPRFVAILTTILLGCMLMLLISLVVSTAIAQMGENKGEYQKQTEKLVKGTLEWLPLEHFGYDVNDVPVAMSTIPAKTAGTLISSAASGFMSVMSNGLLVLIFTIFMLAGKRESKSYNSEIYLEIDSSIKKYTTTMLLTSGLTGFLVGLTLSILGVDFAWMFGFFAFLLNFIPNIGSVIATLLPVPVVILNSQLGVATQILAVAIPAVIQFTIGNLVQPKLMGRTLNLHPVAILLSLIFFGAIWGIVGMFLATPITVVLRILLEKFEYTAPIANLIAAKVNKPSPGKR
ncbi:MAG: AI-2E family transporter [Aliifodinibius sp.]|nr:AI-2E family transporter [Phycisphaerae bacterium]NIR68082.1 AI-2E family transporter [candidate division Zixibacteria bacterium]NIT61921.1 AI-2E family transporter [Fodinibius sp.]NIS49301.1 AI-2E family transporter [candidate division Zixibacteria bacterium]NIU16319.1 AI-2E family transporter [candidate division Zixibacteria bacterium]